MGLRVWASGLMAQGFSNLAFRSCVERYPICVGVFATMLVVAAMKQVEEHNEPLHYCCLH